MAWNLAKAFDLAGFQIHQVISRNEVSGKELAGKYAAYFSVNTKDLMADADFVFLALPDKNIEPVIQEIKQHGPIFVACAGSFNLENLSKHALPAAIFYPLQTLTKESQVDFFKIPIFVEASDGQSLAKITDLASVISNTVVPLSSEKRAIMHLAAVFANNFTNHLLAQSEKIMLSHDLPIKYLKPLVEETVKKAFESSPENHQTGPAKRNDEPTLSKHLALLKENKALRELYKMLSKNINPDIRWSDEDSDE